MAHVTQAEPADPPAMPTSAHPVTRSEKPCLRDKRASLRREPAHRCLTDPLGVGRSRSGCRHTGCSPVSIFGRLQAGSLADVLLSLLGSS